MNEISISDLRVSDIGSRVIVIDSKGNAYDGVLNDIRSHAWKYGKREEEGVRTTIEVSSDEKSKIELSALPLDFRLQVHRDN